jgi:hypothetical protein
LLNISQIISLVDYDLKEYSGDNEAVVLAKKQK